MELFNSLKSRLETYDKPFEHWTYEGLDEVNRASVLVKEKMKKNGII